MKHFSKSQPRSNPTQNLLPPEFTPFGELRLTTSRPTKNGRAGTADDDGLGVRVDGGDLHAAGTPDIHEVGAGGLHKILEKRGGETM